VTSPGVRFSTPTQFYSMRRLGLFASPILPIWHPKGFKGGAQRW
jgi:hypothetical protein